MVVRMAVFLVMPGAIFGADLRIVWGEWHGEWMGPLWPGNSV